MSVAFSANTATRDYTANMRLAAQQKTHRFAGTYTERPGMATGERVSVDEIFGETQGKEREQKFEPIEINNPDSVRPWIVQRPYSNGVGVDKLDEVSTKIDLKGAYTMAGVADINRFLDKAFLDAFSADMIVGTHGTSTQAFDTTNYRVANTVGASAATGMNSEKILAAREIILAGDVDLDDPDNQMYMGLTAKMERQLLDDPRVTSSQYRNTLLFDTDENGKKFLRGWNGVLFIHYEKMKKSGSDFLVPFWCKSGVQAATWQDITGNIRQLPHLKGQPWYAEWEVNKNFTRTEQKKTVQILAI